MRSACSVVDPPEMIVVESVVRIAAVGVSTVTSRDVRTELPQEFVTVSLTEILFALDVENVIDDVPWLDVIVPPNVAHS